MDASKRLRIARVVVPLLVIGFLLWWFVIRPGGSDADLESSGTVEATEAQLGFQVAGRIEAIEVWEGDRVTTGDELANLDLTETLARRAQTEAQVRAARALLDEMESGYRTEEVMRARAEFEAARQRSIDAGRDLKRAEGLIANRVISEEELEKTQVSDEVARQNLAAAEQNLKIMETGPRAEKIEAQRAQLLTAEASLAVIDATIANMTVTAPFDGVVTVRNREPGEIVAAGSPVVTVMNPEDRWVRIYVREDIIGAVHVGTKAAIESDTYSDKVYEGEVIFIASEAEFTPKNVQTKEERVKLVFAVKVRITGDAAQELKPGMPADVRLDLHPQ
jgi:HlyD family secretion protein